MRGSRSGRSSSVTVEMVIVGTGRSYGLKRQATKEAGVGSVARAVQAWSVRQIACAGHELYDPLVGSNRSRFRGNALDDVTLSVTHGSPSGSAHPGAARDAVASSCPLGAMARHYMRTTRGGRENPPSTLDN